MLVLINLRGKSDESETLPIEQTHTDSTHQHTTVTPIDSLKPPLSDEVLVHQEPELPEPELPEPELPEPELPELELPEPELPEPELPEPELAELELPEPELPEPELAETDSNKFCDRKSPELLQAAADILDCKVAGATDSYVSQLPLPPQQSMVGTREIPKASHADVTDHHEDSDDPDGLGKEDQQDSPICAPELPELIPTDRQETAEGSSPAERKATPSPEVENAEHCVTLNVGEFVNTQLSDTGTTQVKETDSTEFSQAENTQVPDSENTQVVGNENSQQLNSDTIQVCDLETTQVPEIEDAQVSEKGNTQVSNMLTTEVSDTDNTQMYGEELQTESTRKTEAENSPASRTNETHISNLTTEMCGTEDQKTPNTSVVETEASHIQSPYEPQTTNIQKLSTYDAGPSGCTSRIDINSKTSRDNSPTTDQHNDEQTTTANMSLRDNSTGQVADKIPTDSSAAGQSCTEPSADKLLTSQPNSSDSLSSSVEGQLNMDPQDTTSIPTDQLESTKTSE